MDSMFPFMAASRSALFAAGLDSFVVTASGFAFLAFGSVAFDSAGGVGTSATRFEGYASAGVVVAVVGSGLPVSSTGLTSFTSVRSGTDCCCDSPQPANNTVAIVMGSRCFIGLTWFKR